MSVLRERKTQRSDSDDENDEKDKVNRNDGKPNRKIKKVEPDQNWIQRLKSDLLNSGEKRKKSSPEEEDKQPCEVVKPGTYWLTRILFLRYLSFIYLIAFLISYNQNKELIGNRGLTPARNFLLNGRSWSSWSQMCGG